MHGKLAISLDTMHTITNDLLIAPLNFATQLEEKYESWVYLALRQMRQLPPRFLNK